MAPLETQVREHHLQLRRRLESIRRIHQASDELEDRIAELEQAKETLDAQLRGSSAELRRSTRSSRRADVLPPAANSHGRVPDVAEPTTATESASRHPPDGNGRIFRKR